MASGDRPTEPGIIKTQNGGPITSTEYGNFRLLDVGVRHLYAAPSAFVSATASTTATSNTSLIAAGGSGVRTYLTTVTVWNSSATSGYVELKDGTSTEWILPAPTSGGCVVTFPVPLRGSDNTAWQFASSVALSTIYVSAAGFQGE